MTKIRNIETPLTIETIASLHAGDLVSITGHIYTARDAAHKRIIELIKKDSPLPFELEGQVIYYTGPAPAKPGSPIGPAGPTTSYRMDPYTPPLLEKGLKGMIGKGLRSPEVINSMKKNHVVYFAAIGGAAAVIAKSIKYSEIIAWNDLGAEAVRKLYVEKFPAIVVIDEKGNDLYETEPEKYSCIEL